MRSYNDAEQALRGRVTVTGRPDGVCYGKKATMLFNRSILKNSFAATLATAFMVISLTACSDRQTAVKPLTLRIGLFSTQDFLPYFVMKEQGFDKRHGLEFAETPSYAGGAAVIAAIVSGDLDVSFVGSVPAIEAAERGLIPGKLVIAAGNNFADPDHPRGRSSGGSIYQILARSAGTVHCRQCA